MATWDELVRRQRSKKIVAAYPVLARPDGQGGLETATLNLSTHALNPDRCVQFHRPCLKGVPQLSQAMTEPFFGFSQATFGYLQVLIGDGRLDDYIEGWQWAGGPVGIALGFPELNTSEFRTIFTGLMGTPRTNDGLHTVPIQDGQALLLARTLAEGEYSGTLASVVQTCLTAAGVTTKDQVAWDAWAAANPFQVWIHSTGEDVRGLLDRLLGPIGCWYTFDRLGRFVVGTLAAPDQGAAAISLVDDVRLLSYERQVLDRHYWKIALKYLTQTGQSPQYGTVTQQDSSILALNARATDVERDTCLTVEADANTVLARLWGLFSVRRVVHRVAAKLEPLALDLHDQVYLERRGARFGLAGNLRVVGFDSVLAGKSQQVKVDLLQ
ncbi:MAG: hypothetical protein HY794_13280 [Desulfarculus sp.]|nr:hypothetical protein [Desulfarculus sp.]